MEVSFVKRLFSKSEVREPTPTSKSYSFGWLVLIGIALALTLAMAGMSNMRGHSEMGPLFAAIVCGALAAAGAASLFAFQTVRLRQDREKESQEVARLKRNLQACAQATEVWKTKAEDAALEAELRFRTMANNAPVMIWMSGPDSACTFVSQRWQDFTGRTAAEEMGTGWAIGVHPDETQSCIRDYQDAFSARKSFESEYRLRRYDGEYRWILDRGAPWYFPDGTFAGYIGSCIDITERKAATDALYRSQKMLQLVLNNIPQRVFWKDQNLRYMGCNSAFAQDAGMDNPSEVIGKTDFEFVWKDFAERYREVDDTILTSGLSKTNFEVPGVAVDGRPLWRRITKVPLRDKQGNIFGVLGAYEDITEQKAVEERIAEQAALLDKAMDAIMVLDMKRNVVYWNKSAERLYGWTAEETVGQSATSLLPGIISETIQTALHDAGEWNGELTLHRKDHSEIIVESHKTLVQDKAGQPKSILIVQTDISERKKFEMKFLRAQRLESVGGLASGIAHDLNNIFTPLVMCSDLLAASVTDDEGKKLLEMLQANAQRGGEMVKQILAFSRGTNGERKPFIVKYTIKEVEALIRSTFPCSIKVTTDIARDLGLIHGDPTQLHQVVMNLAMNARDAMPNGGVLKIEARNCQLDESFKNREARPGDYVLLSVSDTGTGMRPEIRNRIFEPFFTTKEPGKGTGLGLTTVLGIVKSHGGFIDVDSEFGKGTSFKIFLPAKVVQLAAGPVSSRCSLPYGKNDLVLVVDDDRAIRQITKLTLEAYNYRVLIACGGEEAIALCSQHQGEVSLSIIDTLMPGLDGPSTIRALQKMEPEMKFINISGMANKKGAAHSSDEDVQFLLKPYTTQQLLNVVYDVLYKKAPASHASGAELLLDGTKSH